MICYEQEKIQQQRNELGLSFMANSLESFLGNPVLSDKTIRDIIGALIELEYIPKKERMAKTRLKVSRIPAIKFLDGFDCSWLKGGLTQTKVAELSSLSFIDRKENIVFMGPSGIGKTHLMRMHWGIRHACRDIPHIISPVWSLSNN